MFSDEDEFLCRKHRVDDREFRNVSLLHRGYKIRFNFNVINFEFLEIVDLATFNDGNFPKYLRANRVNLGDLIDEPTTGSSRQ